MTIMKKPLPAAYIVHDCPNLDKDIEAFYVTGVWGNEPDEMVDWACHEAFPNEQHNCVNAIEWCPWCGHNLPAYRSQAAQMPGMFHEEDEDPKRDEEL